MWLVSKACLLSCDVVDGVVWWRGGRYADRENLPCTAIGKTQKVDEFEGGFILKIDMWYMATPNDQLEVAASTS